VSRRNRPRWRRIRSDWHTHEKTTGLSSLARDLMAQAIEDNIAGVLERPMSAMLARAPTLAPGVATKTKHIAAALDELAERGIALWWPRLSVLWIIEAADEQTTSDRSWDAVEILLPTWPAEVREAFEARYPSSTRRAVKGVAETPVDPLPDSVPEPMGEALVQASATQGRAAKGEQRRESRPPPPAPPRTTGLRAEDESIAWLRDRLPYARRPQGANALPLLDAKIRELLRAGFTAEQILAGTESHAAAIDAGRAKRSDWRGTYVFSLGWFERILAEHGTPRALSAEQAAEYAARHRRAPDGWRFDRERNLVPDEVQS
jgi:hypothetical protein